MKIDYWIVVLELSQRLERICLRCAQRLNRYSTHVREKLNTALYESDPS